MHVTSKWQREETYPMDVVGVLPVILPVCCQQFLRNMEIFGWNPCGERKSRKEVPVVSSCQEMISGKQ